ncbi:hypothetical protein ANCDUO_09762 [Ancylostoma duodenale]|uniref:Class II aldolase/adducin N-terminal domain-containing protein n=1 Tax=Ancylostoma duodenale TaxID=51022 RepID=A0A0C2GM14_9BILA|nr:hypothetical protein ANCDUO_09762 [Ancylostoma duodenale]
MERRKRVQQLLESKSFCRELEEVIRQESDSCRSDPEHLKTIQRLSELTLPNGAMTFANLHSVGDSLVKVNLQGETVDPGSTKLGINQNGFMLHSAIHSARPDVRCILHMHTAVVSAVASMKCGLLPLCQEAMVIGPVAYHDYQVRYNYCFLVFFASYV